MGDRVDYAGQLIIHMGKIKLWIIPCTKLNPGGFKNWMWKSKLQHFQNIVKKAGYRIGKHTLQKTEKNKKIIPNLAYILIKNFGEGPINKVERQVAA